MQPGSWHFRPTEFWHRTGFEEALRYPKLDLPSAEILNVALGCSMASASDGVAFGLRWRSKIVARLYLLL
jgi:hypothetical protein